MLTQAAGAIRGVGLGLRSRHYDYILNHRPPVPWFEVVVENYFARGGPSLQRLAQIRADYPLAFHAVSLSLGSTDPLNTAYLQQLHALIQRFQPACLSDHLCWASFQGQYFHELLPLPYTPAVVDHVAQRIMQVQDFFAQRILIENVSSYLGYSCSELTEWEFINAVAERADCYILLDINNIYVNSVNHGFDPKHYVLAINPKRVKQLHLAGYQDCHTHLLDNHGSAIAPPVWELYQLALQHCGATPTLIEWDNAIPDFPRLLQEAELAQRYEEQYAYTV